MPERSSPAPPRGDFVYLSVEAFRKLTPQKKQEYVEALKRHLDEVTARHYPPKPQDR